MFQVNTFSLEGLVSSEAAQTGILTKIVTSRSATAFAKSFREVCAELAKRHPHLSILMAHCGTYGGMEVFKEAVAACEAHSNLYLDATDALLNVGKERWKEALDRLGPERIIYGNDYP